MNQLKGTKPDTKGFIKFVAEGRKKGLHPRSLRFYKDGETVLSADFAPYKDTDAMQVYSLSKSFTSACVGVAVGDGLLTTDTKIVDIFPTDAPQNPSERLSKMTLSDVLSMQTGHEKCHLDRMIASRSSIKTFLEQDTVYEPGTTFVYSTGGTMMAGAAVTAVTGVPLDQYLYERIFKPLGLQKPLWDKSPDGICYGGVGLHVTADEILEFAKLLLDGGRGIIPESYIKEATKAHSVDANNGSPDWIAGYGYQFWMNDKGGYRGDGAFGQLMCIWPQKHCCAVLLAQAMNMQDELDVLCDFVNNYAHDESRLGEANELLNTYYAPQKGEPAKALSLRMEQNPCRLQRLCLVPDGDRLNVELWCDHGKQTIVCGNGEYVYNAVSLVNMLPCIIPLHEGDRPEPNNVYASYYTCGDVTTVTLAHADQPHTQTWTIDKSGLKMSVYVGYMYATEIKGIME